ncbi:MAG: family 31 glucosidase [Clostridiales bacterium]|jgi:alpha-D-xyloside xylohydrolase|nr:family 31 glucosidase [Clostridiales bacterium]
MFENGGGDRLIYRWDAEELRVEPWGKNSLRVRATKMAEMPDEDWALLPRPNGTAAEAAEAAAETVQSRMSAPMLELDGSDVGPGGDGCASKDGTSLSGDGGARIRNGGITAEISAAGKLSFYNARGELLLEEYVRNRKGFISEHGEARGAFASALDIDAREFSPITGGDYALTVRFEANEGEKLYGMGQYQQPFLELKGAELELAQRNSQASVPFLVSNRGYGFLWNNPAIGRVTFGKGGYTWTARSTKAMDYWITAADTPAEILEAYGAATGFAPMMPDYAMGFWQCKLRYQTQDELLSVAREYKRRNLPISVIVVDFFHWTCQGDWRFDPVYWPDPEGMVRELREMGIELMVSIWPTVDDRSENFEEMRERGYLIRTERGVRIAMDFHGNTVHFDATNPGAREYVWKKAKRNYYDKGIRIFWLDEAEPEYKVYDFDHYRYHLGSDLMVGNLYPALYAKAFYDGMTAAGQENALNLIRCAWAGSQRYGALVWSGDIHSSFKSLRNQLAAGLNMGLAGIPWWTTDIGGFHGGNPNDAAFRELFVRWFEYGAFCPVMRLHGYRDPHTPPIGTSGGGLCDSGAANEVWSYGDEALAICEKYLALRERMRGYITELMDAAHKKGAPVIRPLFFDFPAEARSWEVEDEYMFGPDVLVAPILDAGARKRAVWLPELPEGGAWTALTLTPEAGAGTGASGAGLGTGAEFAGGQLIVADAPLDTIPVFLRNGRTFCGEGIK